MLNYNAPEVEKTFAGIAQLVEQLIRNQQVVCSSHITSSKFRSKAFIKKEKPEKGVKRCRS